MKCPMCELHLSKEGWKVLKALEEATVEYNE